MTGRTDLGYNDEGMPIGLWRGAVKKAIEGRRGQAALRELLAALLALPEHRLAFDSLYDGRDSCAIGVLALSRAQDAEERDEVILQLLGEDGGDIVAMSQFAFEELGLTYTLAWEIIEANDSDEGHLTPEERWREVVGWVRARIYEPPPPAPPTITLVDQPLRYPDISLW